VSADTWATNRAFAEADGLEFPLLSDWPDGQAIAAFGVGRAGSSTAARVTFVFDTGGVVRAIIDAAGDVEAHAIGALEAVRALADATSS
jgi:peroxiredoxin